MIATDTSRVARYLHTGELDWSLAADVATPRDDIEAVSCSIAGEVVIVGTHHSGSEGSYGGPSPEITATKLSKSGQVVWRRAFSTEASQPGGMGLNGSRGMGVTVGSGGEVYVGGNTSGRLTNDASAGGLDVFVARLDPDGSTEWEHQFGTDGAEFVRSMHTTSSGELYLLGDTSGDFTGGRVRRDEWDVFVTKFDERGKQAWTRQVGQRGPRHEHGSALAVSSDGSVYVGGSTREVPRRTHARPVYDDVLLSKLDATGRIQWSERFVGHHRLSGVVVGAAGELYLAGFFDAAGMNALVPQGDLTTLLKLRDRPD